MQSVENVADAVQYALVPLGGSSSTGYCCYCCCLVQCVQSTVTRAGHLAIASNNDIHAAPKKSSVVFLSVQCTA